MGSVGAEAGAFVGEVEGLDGAFEGEVEGLLEGLLEGPSVARIRGGHGIGCKVWGAGMKDGGKKGRRKEFCQTMRELQGEGYREELRGNLHRPR